MAIMMPQGPAQDNSMTRRLFSLAAPIAGFAIGGPAGAAIGSTLGGLASGESGTQAALGGAKSFMSSKKNVGGADDGISGSDSPDLPQLQKPDLGDSAFGRRISSLSQDPRIGVAQGLDALSQLPVDHPLRQEYTPILVRAQMMGER